MAMFFIMKKFLAVLLVVFFSASTSVKANEIASLLSGKWYKANLLAISTEANKTDTVNQLVFFGDEFTWVDSSNSIFWKGTWKLQIDSTLELLLSNIQSDLIRDSVYARIDSINIAKDSTLIKRFNLFKINNEILVLKQNGVDFTFKHNAPKGGNALSFGNIMNGLLGMISLVLILWLFSEKKRKVNWRLVLSGMALQLIFAYLVLRVPFVKSGFESVSEFFVLLLGFTRAGSEFLFGNLISVEENGYIFILQVLPTIIFFAALTSTLYYLGVLQKIVYVFAWIMKKTMQLSGAESLAAAGNIFLGQTEAPLLIRPYIDRMTRSEIMALMTGGMATIAGGVLAAYIGFLGGADEEQQTLFATHLLSASIMSAPASLIAAKILVPETEPINEELKVSKDKIGSNLLDAISNGTTDGLKLAVNVGAMLLVFTALMAMVNWFFLAGIGEWFNLNEGIKAASNGAYDGFSLQYVLGKIFAPIAWLVGVRGNDITLVGQLLGEKTILNEFFAYTSLGNMKTMFAFESERSIIIATYALCGFANFASIGIQIGGIGSLAPGKRSLLSSLGLKALLGGTFACLLTGAIAGMLV